MSLGSDSRLVNKFAFLKTWAMSFFSGLINVLATVHTLMALLGTKTRMIAYSMTLFCSR